jgi:hypothetical protein
MSAVRRSMHRPRQIVRRDSQRDDTHEHRYGFGAARVQGDCPWQVCRCTYRWVSPSTHIASLIDCPLLHSRPRFACFRPSLWRGIGPSSRHLRRHQGRQTPLQLSCRSRHLRPFLQSPRTSLSSPLSSLIPIRSGILLRRGRCMSHPERLETQDCCNKVQIPHQLRHLEHAG